MKYFSDTPEGAVSYAKQAYNRWPSEGPYILVSTEIPESLITPEMRVTVDRGVDAVVVPSDMLSDLASPSVESTMPIP